MNVGVVLSGGMAKGAYQIGVLKALNDFIPLDNIKFFSCSSVGALNGYAYATQKLGVAERMWRELCADQCKLTINQVLRDNMLWKNIVQLCDPPRLNSKFYCCLFDYSRFNVVYKELSSTNSSLLPLHLCASVTLPLCKKAVKIGESSYFDGAIIDNIPVYPLVKHDLYYIICVHFDDISYQFENDIFDKKTIKIVVPCRSAIKQSIVLSKERIDEMIESGYVFAYEILRNVFAKGRENLEHIYRFIGTSDGRAKKRELRITGSACLTNINKFALKLTKRKIV